MLHIGIADNIARVNTRQNAALRAAVAFTVRAESVVLPVVVVAVAAFVAALFI